MPTPASPPSVALAALARARRVPPLTLLLGLLLMLGALNLGHWRYYHVFRESKEEDLRQRLTIAAEALAQQTENLRPWFLELVTAQPTGEDQIAALTRFSSLNDFQRLDPLTKQTRDLFELASCSILTNLGMVVAGDEWRFFELDQLATSAALHGEVGVTERYVLDGRPFQRVYAPIRSIVEPTTADDESPPPIVGLAAVALSPDYLDQLTQLERRAIRQSLISSALLLVLGFSLWRLLTHARRLETRTLQGQRAEAMGVLAGGLAHELRNPLGIIRVLGEEVQAEAPPESQIAANIKDILEEVDRLSGLTDRFLSLARAPGHDPVSTGENLPAVDALEEIRAVVHLARKSRSTSFPLVLNDLNQTAPVAIPPEALRQILLNLLLNALDAVEGMNSSPSYEKSPRSPVITVSPTIRKEVLEIRIQDNGDGMDNRALQRAFDPFYTTKPRGSGLGLAISRAIAHNFGAELELKSQPGQGTTAILRVPLAK